MKKLITLAAITVSFLVSCKQEVYYSIATKVQPDGAGSIVASPSSGQVQEGASVTFTAKPNGEFAFTGWSGSFSGTENPKTVTAYSNLNVIANFTLRSYPLTITVEGEGSVTEKVISTKADYTSGTTIELTAQAAEHWLFERWEGDLNGNTNPAQITVTSSMSIKAVFVKKMYDLTVTVEGEGAVGEKIVETKSGSYQEGTIVELTATPSTGWSFGHWEGDLTGIDNPATITISSVKTVKAVFTKNKYSYNLKIVGPGVVDEYLVETKSSFEYDTKILLKAIHSDGAVFKGWSGDILGTNENVEVVLEKEMSITASFESPIHRYPTPDLLQPSVALKRLYYGIDFSGVTGWGHVFGTFDYNKDGLPDVINNPISPNGVDRNEIDFYLGSESGDFSKDFKNIGFTGMIWLRKVIFGDYNGDNMPDICLIGHGWDDAPWPGEYPVILLSQPEGRFKELRLSEYVSFFHGGASADIDNDGDLDIFLICSGHGPALFLLNDGFGNFVVRDDLFPQGLRDGMYNAELFDIDKDGYIDLIVGTDDHLGEINMGDNLYNNTSIVFWGNGETFDTESYTRLPKTAVDGFGLVTDFDFFDIDKDGIEELIVARTGDGFYQSFVDVYCGMSIQVIKRNGRSFKDVTDKIIGVGNSYDVNTGWIILIDFEEVDGQELLVARFDHNARALFRISDGRLIPYEESPIVKKVIKNGLCIYADSFRQWEDYYDSSCKDDPVAGANCLKFSGWKQWDGIWFSFHDYMENGADLSPLLEEDYALEFYIKNNDPSLKIDIKIESFLDRESWSLATFFYQYDGQQHNYSNEWEHIVVPLSSFDDWSDHKVNYWSDMDHIHFQISSEGGQDFYLDEIRIRKVLLG